MKKLGKTQLRISRQGLGCMSMSEFYGDPISDENGIELIKFAFANGINFFDTADGYGYGHNEILIGKAVHALLNEGISRSEIVIASKCGIVRDINDPTKRGIDNSYQYVLDRCSDSIKRLNLEYVDLYYLHRIANDGAQIDEAMLAMAELLADNKIKAVGLSEAKPEIIRQANNALLKYTENQHQLAAVQTEYSLLTRNVEHNGVLSTCRELDITFVAYSPLSRALLTGKVTAPDQQFESTDFRRHLPRFQGENLVKNQEIVLQIEAIASHYPDYSVAQVALAWILHKGVVPIPGTTKKSNLLSNISAEKLVLKSEDLTTLDQLDSAQGHRYSEAAMKAFNFND